MASRAQVARRDVPPTTVPIMNILVPVHPFKLFLPDSRVNCRKHFFAVRVLRIWNSIPEEVVSADHLSLFVRTLKHVNLSQFLFGKV